MSLVIDAHQHFLDPASHRYPWLTPDLAVLDARFGPDDLAPLDAAAGIDRSIVVQTHSSARETREFLATAAVTPSLAGVVGWVDLTDPGVADAIAELRAGPGGDRLVGIRHQVHDEPDPDWLGRPAVRRGIAAVGAAGLAYDLLLRPREMPAGRATVQALPDVRFVLDHLAKPEIAKRAWEPWAGLLTELAAAPNTWCKLSALVTEAAPGWTVADLRPYVDHALTRFGPERMLFGSDWPVCRLAASHAEVVAAARALTAELSPTERAAIFGGSATDVYRLASR